MITAVFLTGMLCAYLIGSINFAILFFRLLGKDDPRRHFSGNAGVSNVYRQAGLGAAGLVLVFDVGRAMGVALVARHFLPSAMVPWAGLGLIFGNHFSCFHGWPCGKGVANYLGFYALLLPLGTALALVVYVTLAGLTRISFLGSMGIVGVLSVFAVVHWSNEPFALAAIALTAVSLVLFHRKNIALHMRGKALAK